jgi:hypothetical protein
MLEAVLTDIAEQGLQVRDADDAGAAESVERIVGEFAFADVAPDLAFRLSPGLRRCRRCSHARPFRR